MIFKLLKIEQSILWLRSDVNFLSQYRSPSDGQEVCHCDVHFRSKNDQFCDIKVTSCATWELVTLIQHVYINTLLCADLMRRKRMCQYVDTSECYGFHKLYCVYRVWIRAK